MVSTLPPPSALLGLPPGESSSFPAWYPNQDRVVSMILEWLTRPDAPKYFCLQAPTGSGKALVGAVTAQLSGRRAAFLTSTKGLQDQVLADFHGIGFRDIRGQNSYPCILTPEARLTVDEGPCHAGARCPHSPSGDNSCIYYSELRRARRSKFVVTNYAMWLAQSNMRPDLTIGRMPLLVCDEADDAFKAIESHLTSNVARDECRAAGFSLPSRGNRPETWPEWQEWAHRQFPHAQRAERELRQTLAGRDHHEIPREDLRKMHALRRLTHKLATLRGGLGEWVWRDSRSGVVFTPVWPGLYSSLIFGDSDRALVMSATLTPKTVDLLGIPEDDRVWVEMPTAFPPYRTPVQHVRTIRVDYRASDVDLRAWVNRIDQIIDRRLDRKGLILPVSYERGNFIYRNTRHRDRMIVHGPREVTQAVERWRRSPAPSVLISPAVNRGYDFPGDECRYIIIGKIPFMDGRDPVAKARNESDPEYAGYQTMQTLVQEAGRGTRSRTIGPR